MKKALLVLEDGTSYLGKSFGAEGEVYGEIVFNTSMTGYQEVLTDPSYANQIVVMTYPEIGIYGINTEDIESSRIWVKGFVVFRAVEGKHNHRATGTLIDYLVQNGIVAVEGVDTRAITRRIRNYGVMRGVISTIDMDADSLLSKVRQTEPLIDIDLVKEVSPKQTIFDEGSGPRIALIDCGVKFGILRELRKRGFSVVRLPYTIDFEDLKRLGVCGVLVSNGPGDPSALSRTIELIRQTLSYGLPLAGICLGHQLLGLAIGARTYKMKFGHRGVNHPVKDLEKNKILITTHNHGFAVDPTSLGITWIPNVEQKEVLLEKLSNVEEMVGESSAGFGKVKITHVSLNDGTIEGIRLVDHPVMSVQFHPEASPGPHDANPFFDDFVHMVQGG